VLERDVTADDGEALGQPLFEILTCFENIHGAFLVAAIFVFLANNQDGFAGRSPAPTPAPSNFGVFGPAEDCRSSRLVNREARS
jgi:hypothetical protein